MAKKITAIVSLTLFAAVIIATIVLANIKVNHNIKYRTPEHMSVTYDGNIQTEIVDEKEKEHILKLMKNATSENMLTAIFKNTLNKKPKLVNFKETSSSIPGTNDFYLIFTYNNPQKIDGVEDFYYVDLVFTISNTKGAKEMKVYISEDGSMNYRKYYEIDVDYSEIYDYLTEKGYKN